MCSVIVDAGTGLRALGNSREWLPATDVHLLLTHLHHDHVIGLPFFKPLHVPGMTLHIWCGNLEGETAEAALRCMFAPPLFPFRLDQVKARIVFHGFRAGETIEVTGEQIATVALKHPSGATGYRFGDDPGALAIITDIEHELRGPDPALVDFCRGVDTVLYDTMLAETDYGSCKGWGHSTAAEAIKLMKASKARRLVGFHHDPGAGDSEMTCRESAMQESWPESLMAREGQKLTCSAALQVTEPVE
jgi:phosphoribosyl 1,2-cyclic phosphodiesterase